jgi:hypothetical protein
MKSLFSVLLILLVGNIEVLSQSAVDNYNPDVNNPVVFANPPGNGYHGEFQTFITNTNWYSFYIDASTKYFVSYKIELVSFPFTPNANLSNGFGNDCSSSACLRVFETYPLVGPISLHLKID